MAKKSTKKKVAKRSSSRKTKAEEPMSKGFGHLTIPKDARVTGSAWVEGGDDPRPESQRMWEDCEWE